MRTLILYDISSPYPNHALFLSHSIILDSYDIVERTPYRINTQFSSIPSYLSRQQHISNQFHNEATLARFVELQEISNTLKSQVFLVTFMSSPEF